jgi:hypothetical protein
MYPVGALTAVIGAIAWAGDDVVETEACWREASAAAGAGDWAKAARETTTTKARMMKRLCIGFLDPKK